jgi:hypothetical protein
MEPIEAQRRSRSNGLCECLLAALALYGLAPGNASAGDQQGPDARRNADTQKTVRAQIAAPSFPAPFALSVPNAETQAFSPTEFRPRKPGAAGAVDAGSEGPLSDAPLLRDSSIARELSEAKTQDRVRLLTLWQSRASSLSLQAGKHGAPSLQWSTPWMRRDSEARGVFDRLLMAAPHSFGSIVRGGGSHPAGVMAPAKALDLGAPVNSR